MQIKDKTKARLLALLCCVSLIICGVGLVGCPDDDDDDDFDFDIGELIDTGTVMPIETYAQVYNAVADTA